MSCLLLGRSRYDARAAVTNALAFSGSNFLFSKLRGADVLEERKRHDKAIGRLQAAQAAWAWRRTERLDFINEELRRQAHSVKTFHDVDSAMREYNIVTGKTLEPVGPEPQLSDFYTPSDGQKDRDIAFIVLGMAVTGLVAYEISKKSAK